MSNILLKILTLIQIISHTPVSLLNFPKFVWFNRTHCISLQKRIDMRVISFSIIRDFIAKHADADVPLRDWYRRTTKANWNNFADIKQTFNTVDYVGNDRYVFDIKGNNYRIVAIVLFINKKVYMRFVGTHEEYNKIKDIKNI